MLNININEKSIKGTPIIRDIDISLEAGKMMLVLAPSGCGKSTLIKCILGETKYDGTIKSDGKNRVAYVAQEPTTNEKETVYNAVYYTALMDYYKVPKNQIKKLTRQTIISLGLAKVAHHKARDISGGQQRRLQIAEALIRQSDVILMDEPDSSLDAATSYNLTKDIRNIVHNEKKKAIIVSHHITKEAIELYDDILCLAKDSNNIGTIAYYGKPAFIYQYFNQSSFLEILLDLQTKAENGRGYGSYYTDMYQNLSMKKKKQYRSDYGR